MISEDAIEKYKARWDATTPSDWLPCPFCYTFHKKDSPLTALPEEHGMEFVKCTVCKEKISIPIPKP